MQRDRQAARPKISKQSPCVKRKKTNLGSLLFNFIESDVKYMAWGKELEHSAHEVLSDSCQARRALVCAEGLEKWEAFKNRGLRKALRKLVSLHADMGAVYS